MTPHRTQPKVRGCRRPRVDRCAALIERELEFDILRQPDDTTCGPTCLHSIYRYYEDDCDLADVIDQVPKLPNGGTLAVQLACHALRRGYRATIYTYNLQMFDPTWFSPRPIDLVERIRLQAAHKTDARIQAAGEAYVQFLDLGGLVRLEDLTTQLIRRYLKRSVPILTGLSATFLYRVMREYGPKCDDDDVRGVPAGHFVVLCGYLSESREVIVADPLHPNPPFESHRYSVGIDRVIGAIFLGVLTHDANLLVIEPKAGPSRRGT